MTTPVYNGGNGRGPDGRFVPGCPGGPGRPRAIDFRSVVERKASEHGVDVEDVIWAVFQDLIDGSNNHDTGASRALLDRLHGVDGRMIAAVATEQLGREFLVFAARASADACRELGLLAEQSRTDRLCDICGALLTADQKKYCGRACHAEAQKHNKARSRRLRYSVLCEALLKLPVELTSPASS